MKIQIEYVKGTPSKEDLMALKAHIEKKKIKDLKKVEAATIKPKKGEMGAGLIPALTGLIGSATEPLTTLCMTLVEWVKLKRSDIRIIGASGAEICISGKLKEKDLTDALEKFYAQEKTNVKTGAKRGGAPKPPAPPADGDKK
ncbi:MAG: hypothetical protein MJZ66_06225 [Bacteroidales bacterium]|nr:hypothetical protein [Bacteroidales bacterium]